jgi:hypothetical protein
MRRWINWTVQFNAKWREFKGKDEKGEQSLSLLNGQRILKNSEDSNKENGFHYRALSFF